MRSRFRLLSALLLLTVTLATSAQRLPRSTPEEQGVPSAVLQKFMDETVMQPDGAECHSVMVLRHGNVIAEAYPAPFSSLYPHTLYSCSKTFTALAVGLAVDSNLLRVTDRVATLLPDKLPATISHGLADLTVADLLTMSSGITPDWNMRNNNTDWTNVWLAKPVTDPGTKFQYDSMCTYLLSEIVQRVTGKTVLELLNEHIFGPLEIKDAEWEVSPEGFNTGGWGLRIRPEDMAKTGQLILQKGRWNDRQLVSEEWIENMMTPHIRANAKEHYGYQMWDCGELGAWRADGAFGQFIVVLPEQDMVVILTQCSSRGGKVLDPVWTDLAPSVSDEPLPPSEDASTLAARTLRYEIKPAVGSAKNRNSRLVNGKTFTLPANSMDWHTLTFDLDTKERLRIAVTTTAGEHYDIDCGFKRWITVTTPVCPPYSIKAQDRFSGISRDFAVSGSYAWLPDGTLTWRVYWPSWITGAYVTFNPKAHTMTVKENIQPKPYTLHIPQ